MLDGGGDEAASSLRVAVVERRVPGVQQFITDALPLGHRTARPLDIGARACMTAIEKQHPRPHVDREFVLFGKIMIEPREQELFDARVAVTFRHVCRRGQTV